MVSWCGTGVCWICQSQDGLEPGSRGCKPGDLLQLHLHIPGQGKPLSVRLATIRWANESHVGVDPILMDADDQSRLNAFVHDQRTASAFTGQNQQIVIFDGG